MPELRTRTSRRPLREISAAIHSMAPLSIKSATTKRYIHRAFSGAAAERPRLAAPAHQDLGVGFEEAESKSAPDAPRGPGDQCAGTAEAHLSCPRIAYFVFVCGNQRVR
jgi:hypothetical protein